MTGKEILAWAKTHYPEGTTFVSPWSGDRVVVGKNVDHKIEVEWDGTKALVYFDGVDGGRKSRYVFYKNEWGKILKESEMKKTQKISREAVREIYDKVCTSWQLIIEDKLKQNMFNDEIEVYEDLIIKGLKEADPEQRKLILKYLKEPKPDAWQELGVIKGHYVTHHAEISEEVNGFPAEANKNIFATEKQAKSALAAAQLSQYMAKVNEGWEPDWSAVTSSKYCISRDANTTIVGVWTTTYKWLSFKSKEVRDKFLQDHLDLIKTYFEL